MRTLRIEIQLENSVFENDTIVRIEEVLEKVQIGTIELITGDGCVQGEPNPILDLNGNKVGFVEIVETK